MYFNGFSRLFKRNILLSAKRFFVRSVLLNAIARKFGTWQLKRNRYGYIIILLTIAVPLILWGTRLALDLMTVHELDDYINPSLLKKNCAREAALKVAQNWNPGLTYFRQKETMLRIADNVYNRSQAVHTSMHKYNAIPDLQMPTGVRVTKGGQFDPLEVTYTSFIHSKFKQILQSPKTKTWRGYYFSFSYSTHYAPTAVRQFFIMHETLEKNFSVFSNDDAYSMYCYKVSNTSSPTGIWSHHFDFPEVVSSPSLYDGTYSATTPAMAYEVRSNPEDKTVQIAVEDDKIKAITDDNVGYAVPAECNVDIVLSIPVNGAASNINNYDTNTPTSGTPYMQTDASPTTEAQKTPIWQISQAYRIFLKNNFFYTRGVNVGVIPYSGNVTLKGTGTDSRSSWAKVVPTFNPNNLAEPYIIGAMLYGTKGTKGTTLTTAGTVAGKGNDIYGLGLLCRGKMVSYNGIDIEIGDLLSTVDPSSYQFRRFVYQPCYAGYANLLSGKCEQDCKKQWMNPYFILELNNDVKFIYEMCGVFYPYYDDRNNSNFIFIPVTWANNLFQSWSKNPSSEACDTSNDKVDGPASGQLSSQSKMTPERKKVLILVVNKPDWFEPGELTYLGFDNDLSELPMIESDCIRGDINYSDTSKKFADGTSYDGTIQGSKKILKFSTSGGAFGRKADTGYYECTTADSVVTGTLTFPKKYLVKIMVESANNITWEQKSCNLNSISSAKWYSMGRVGVGPVNGVANQLLIHDQYGKFARSTDGITWTCMEQLGDDGWFVGSVYGNGKWVAINKKDRDNGIQYSSNATSWTGVTLREARNEGSLAFGNGIFMTIAANSNDVYISSDGASWTKRGKVPGSQISTRILGYGNNKWIAGQGAIYESKDDGNTWNLCDSSLNDMCGSGVNYEEWYGCCYANGAFYAINYNVPKIARSVDGKNWEEVTQFSCGNHHRNITLYNDKLYCFAQEGKCCHIGTFTSSIQFKDISPQENGTTTNTYNFTKRKEFFIEPEQITATDADGNCIINFDMKNVRLISAEITNRPYTKVTPTCSLSGTTNGTGVAYIYTNVKRPLTINATQVSDSSITFSNIEGSNISNVGTHNIIEEKTFTFPSSNFDNNYSKKKIACSLNNVEIVSASLVNQIYRLSNRTVDEGIITDYWVGDNTWGQGSNVWCLNQNGYLKLSIANVTNSITANVNVERSIDGAGNWGTPDVYCYFFNELLGRTNRVKNENNNAINLNITDKVLSSADNSALFEIRAPSISGYANCTNRIFVRTFNVKCNDNRSLNSGITFESGYICFCGIGDLSVTVGPIMPQSTIKYNNAEKATVSLNIQDTQIITISSETHYYEKQSDGRFRITLDITNLELSNLQLVDNSYAFEYTKPRLPNRSRVVDFSTRGPGYDSALISCRLNDLRYDKDLGCWVSGTTNYPFSEFYNQNMIGDFFFLLEDIGVITPQLRFFNRLRGPETFKGVKNELYLIPGLHRRYQIYDDIRRIEMASFDLPNSHLGGQVQYYWTGFTLPINCALYYGAKEATVHEYQWQADNSGNVITISPTEAVKKVTKDACAKLKSDWGSNIRIYLIKYRKQSRYKHKITQNDVDFDYNYLSDCASGDSAPYMYDVSTQSDLESALSSIASDIKSWAGYSKAKNVE